VHCEGNSGTTIEHSNKAPHNVHDEKGGMDVSEEVFSFEQARKESQHGTTISHSGKPW